MSGTVDSEKHQRKLTFASIFGLYFTVCFGSV